MDTTEKEQAMSLRLRGLTYAEIGKEFGISRQRIQQLLSPPPAIERFIKNRAQGKCENCGLDSPKGHIHHRTATGTTSEDYNDIPNLQLLCASCHRLAHGIYVEPPDPKQLRCPTCGQKLRVCQGCGKDISDRDVRALRCKTCKQKSNQSDYRQRLKERRS